VTEIPTPINTLILDDSGNYYIGTDEGLIIKPAITGEATEIHIGRVLKIRVSQPFGTIYALTDNSLYSIDPVSFKVGRNCPMSISDFQTSDGKLFYVSNFTSTYGVMDLLSCSKIDERNIQNPKGIAIRGEE
jgi:hypothetical protein